MHAIPDADLWRMYRTASVFVNLSSSEAFGLAALEALAGGCPAIVSKLSGLAADYGSELDGLIAVDSEWVSPSSLARLIQDYAGAVISPNLERFSWDAIADRYRGLYETLLER